MGNKQVNGMHCKRTIKNNYGFFAGLLLIILPKCPFCILAYSGTAMLCGEGVVLESKSLHVSPATIFITALFSFLVIIGILMNNRGLRTRYALTLAGAGIFLVLFSVLRSGGKELYYTGVLIIFISVWLNGSLISILRKLKRTFHGIPKTAESSPYS